VVGAAIIGAAGVVVGVVVGGLLGGYLSAAQERRQDKNAAIAASRLLERELRQALLALERWRREGHVQDPARADALRFPAWKLYHLVAARSLPPDHWYAVSEAYLLLYTVRTGEEFQDALGAEALGRLQATATAISAAVGVLAPHART
jgi:hypothetical protein